MFFFSLISFLILSPIQTSLSQNKNSENGEPRTILFLGNSLSAGYGLSPAQAFPNLIQQKIDSLDWHFEVINAGLSGETTSGGLRRVDWILRRKIDVLVLELGGNDALRGIDPNLTESNLQGILDKTRKRYPDVKFVIAGMLAPTNFGSEYTEKFKAIFSKIAEKNDAALIPFLLEDVGGIPGLNQADGIHPTAKGHQIVAETVWRILKPVLLEMNGAESREFIAE